MPFNLRHKEQIDIMSSDLIKIYGLHLGRYKRRGQNTDSHFRLERDE